MQKLPCVTSNFLCSLKYFDLFYSICFLALQLLWVLQTEWVWVHSSPAVGASSCCKPCVAKIGCSPSHILERYFLQMNFNYRIPIPIHMSCLVQLLFFFSFFLTSPASFVVSMYRRKWLRCHLEGVVIKQEKNLISHSFPERISWQHIN